MLISSQCHSINAFGMTSFSLGRSINAILLLIAEAKGGGTYSSDLSIAPALLFPGVLSQRKASNCDFDHDEKISFNFVEIAV